MQALSPTSILSFKEATRNLNFNFYGKPSLMIVKIREGSEQKTRYFSSKVIC